MRLKGQNQLSPKAAISRICRGLNEAQTASLKPSKIVLIRARKPRAYDKRGFQSSTQGVGMKLSLTAFFLTLMSGYCSADDKVAAQPSVGAASQNQQSSQNRQTLQPSQQNQKEGQQNQPQSNQPKNTQPNLIDFCKEHTC